MDTSECEGLCTKLLDRLQQDVPELSGSLQGEILDAYEQVIQAELESLWEIRKRLNIIE